MLIMFSTAKSKFCLFDFILSWVEPVLSKDEYFTNRSKAVLLLWIFYVFSVLCLLCLCVRLFKSDLWSSAGKGLTSLVSFVVSNCEFVSLPLVSWVRCET